MEIFVEFLRKIYGNLKEILWKFKRKFMESFKKFYEKF